MYCIYSAIVYIYLAQKSGILYTVQNTVASVLTTTGWVFMRRLRLFLGQWDSDNFRIVCFRIFSGQCEEPQGKVKLLSKSWF